MDWIINRLKEKSTYTGLSLLAGVAGYAIAPGAFELICMGVVSLHGIIETVSEEPEKQGEWI
jgi:hypothetical protein